MSHIMRQEAGITDPIPELLQQTIENVAARHQGDQILNNCRGYYYKGNDERMIRPYYIDYYNREFQVITALYTNDCFRGLGIQVNQETREMEFISDPYGHNYKVAEKALKEEIQVAYARVCAVTSMIELGYLAEQVEPEEENSSAVLIHATREAHYA